VQRWILVFSSLSFFFLLSNREIEAGCEWQQQRRWVRGKDDTAKRRGLEAQGGDWAQRGLGEPAVQREARWLWCFGFMDGGDAW
jgi:hypothetical protein